MKHLKTYKMFESSVELTPEQIKWLDKCTRGTWQLNPKTGEVDVDGGFNCSGQGLSDFKGVRFGVVRGFFYCHDNELSSLEGAPQKVGGAFDCRNNQLTTLEGAPRKVRGDFYCSNNPVSAKTLKSIFGIMETGKSYLEATEYLWPEIPLEDQTLLYRPEFDWIGSDEVRKLDALRAYQGFKGMI